MVSGSEDGPDPTDSKGWRRAIAGQHLQHIRPEAMVATIQAMGPDGDQQVLGPLMQHLSDRVTRILLKYVGRNKANAHDIIERARHQILEHILQPQTSDGKGLREAFFARVTFRAADAIRKEDKQASRELAHKEDEQSDAAPGEPPPWPEAEQSAWVAGLLRNIPDARKRLAFQLHMDGVPYTSAKGASISRALDVSAKTVAVWIDEVQTQLKKMLED